MIFSFIDFILFSSIIHVLNANIADTFDHNTKYGVSEIDHYLFDLNNDPYEENDVFEDSSYSDKLTYLKKRYKYWKNYVYDNPGPDIEGREDVWNELGGISPWLEDDFVPITVEQKYFYDNAPHIIFVLVDDWGYNDFGLRSTYMNWTTPTVDRLATEGEGWFIERCIVL